MERNTILAIALSALVLFGYQTIFPAPKQAGDVSKNSQVNATQSVSEINSPAAVALPTASGKPTNSVIKTEDHVIKSTNANFSYTNMGGSLHNVDFLGNNPFPLTDVLNIGGFENAPFTGQKIDDQTVSLFYKDKNLQIIKIFKNIDKNLIKVRMEIKNISEISILNNFAIQAFNIDESKMDLAKNSRDVSLFEYSVYSKSKFFRKGNASKFSSKNDQTVSMPFNWIGFRDHYNAFIVKPEFDTKEYEIKALNENELTLSFKPQDRSIAPGESVLYEFSIYAGPQNPWAMKKYGKDFNKIVAFSGFVLIEWIGQAIYHIIPFFHGIFKSWGVSIILISAMLYGVTYPLTMQSMISMRKMQEVQPKMAALKERFKNDPQKLNQEMVEIYRREKINPLGGCLPFLIQMPFFMALYQILWRAQYFQGQGFLWIKDLTQPDRLIIFPFYLPIVGNELNILPILTGLVMFMQQKISTKNTIVTDEQQLMQQKMMMYILPFMMTFMFYKFNSSWAIYFFVFYLLSTATQFKIAQAAGKKV